MPVSTAVTLPNLGLYLDRHALYVPGRALQDGLNFRVKEGGLDNLNLGYTRFGAFTLDSDVLLIDNFIDRVGNETLIFGTAVNLYAYDPTPDTVRFINPIYAVGTVDVSAANPAVVTQDTGAILWNTAPVVRNGDQISFGSATETATTATWYTVDTVDSDTQITLTGAVTGAPLTAQAYTIRRVFTGDNLNIWSTATFVNAGGVEDRWYATNGLDLIVHWDGSDNGATQMTGISITTAKVLVVHANMMIYLNVVQSGASLTTTIVNSDIGDPGDTSSGLSEQFVIHGGTAPIIAAETLGDNLVIYSRSTANGNVTQAQFVGAPDIFVLRQAMAGVGPISARVVADFGDFHEFLGPDSQYRFDGVSVVETNLHVWRDVVRQLDPERQLLAFNHFDEENGDLIWAIPIVTDLGSGDNTEGPEFAWVKHYLEDLGEGLPTPHSKRTFPFTASGYYTRQDALTWDEISDTWADVQFRWNDKFFALGFPLNMVGDEAGKIYTINTEQDADGAALNSFVRFGRRALGDTRMRGLLTRVYPFTTFFLNDIDVTLRRFESAGGNVETTTVFTYDQEQAPEEHFVSVFRRSRFYDLQFGTAGPNEPWRLLGYDTDVKPGGRR